MGSESRSGGFTRHKAGSDMRNQFTEIPSRIRTKAQVAKDTAFVTLEHQREFSADALAYAGKKAARLIRHYPLQGFAAVALGYLSDRSAARLLRQSR